MAKEIDLRDSPEDLEILTDGRAITEVPGISLHHITAQDLDWARRVTIDKDDMGFDHGGGA